MVWYECVLPTGRLCYNYFLKDLNFFSINEGELILKIIIEGSFSIEQLESGTSW